MTENVDLLKAPMAQAFFRQPGSTLFTRMQTLITSLTNSLYLVWKMCLQRLDATLKILMIGRNCFVLKLRLPDWNSWVGG